MHDAPGAGSIRGSAAQRGSTSTARKSLTFVRVGPVTTWSPSAAKKPCASLRASAAAGSTPRAARPRERVRRRQRAGDLGGAVDPVGVAREPPDARRAAPARPRARGRTRRSARRRRSPRRVTVHSPPESSSTGASPGRSPSRISRASRACAAATSRASPSIASPRMRTLQPAASASGRRGRQRLRRRGDHPVFGPRQPRRIDRQHPARAGQRRLHRGRRAMP